MYTMRKVKESKKDKKLKQKRIIKEKQKEKQKDKQQISIVINSNNRNKRTSSAPKQSQQPQPMPQQSRSSNPPVVNVMGDTRPQVTASGNYSGLGQQNRIFAADSGLEQRLARLQKWENDSSANPSPVRSNEKILIKQEKEDEKEILKAPDVYKREDYNFFSPSRPVESEEKEQNQDDVSVFDNDDEETEVNSMDTNDNIVGNSEPPDYEPPSQSLKDKFISLFTPKRNELDNAAPLSASSLSQLNRDTESEAEYAELRKPWKEMKRDEKRQWALENMGNQQGYVSESAAVINKMYVGDLNGLHSKIISERKVVKSKRI